MKKPIVRVSDHAVVRYLERVKGMDVAGGRNEIGQKVDLCLDYPGASGVVVNGFSYKLQGNVVATVMPAHQPDIRTGRVKHKRGRDDET